MNPAFVCATEMLPVPKLIGLDDDQRAGLRCVWCGGPPALTLGPRLGADTGELHRWTPRACRPCAAREAGHVYRAHGRTCAHCTPTVYCPDRRALHALALVCR